MNYYPFHIGDYASATRHLSWDEDAAYRRLLDVYYTTEKPLPLELRAVCRLVIATTDVQREAVAVVLEEFFEQTEAGWVNRRADAEIAAMRERQQKQRDKANKRWQKPRPEPGIAPAMPQHQSRDAAASKADAVAMPPTPTPTPTPTPIGIEREGAQAPAAPETGDPPKRKPKATRGSRRCPAEFTVTDEMRAWAQAEAPHVDLDRETAKFRDHTFRDARTDWLGTWRNWIRRAAELPPPRAATAPSANKPGRYAETIAALTGRNRPNEPETIDVVAIEHPSAPRLG